MTGKTVVPEEAVEAAAPWITNFLERRGLSLRGKEAAVLAGYVFEAAAPFIAAKALEDAADELARLPYVRPEAEGREEYERVLAVRRGNTDKWLRARAAAVRGEG